MAKPRKAYMEAYSNVIHVFFNIGSTLRDCIDSAKIKYELTEEEIKDLKDSAYLSTIALILDDLAEKPNIKKAYNAVRFGKDKNLTQSDWNRIESVLRRTIWLHRGEMEYNKEQNNEKGVEYHSAQVERLEALLAKISPLEIKQEV